MRKGLALHQQGAVDHALEGYREALRVLPDQSDALHLMGVTFHQKGAQAEAIRQRLGEARHRIFNDNRAVEATHRQFARWEREWRERRSRSAACNHCG